MLPMALHAQAPPELHAPEDGATGLPLTITFEWSEVSEADSYQIQISRAQNFSTTFFQRNTSSTSIEVDGFDSDETYYWRVRSGIDMILRTSYGEWSPVQSFQTESYSDPPVTPTLLMPANGATDVSTRDTLKWEAAERADTYDFQVATDSNFNNKVVQLRDVTSTYYPGNFKGNTIYYWRVRARNQSGNSDWSDVWSFTTERNGSSIAVLAPGKNELWNGTRNHTISWQASNNVATVTLEYTKKNTDSWNLIAGEIDASTGSYSWTIPDSFSNSAMIRVSESNNPDNYAISDPFLIYPSSIELDHLYRFNSARSSSDYRLMGLPGDSYIPAEEVFSGSAGKDWNIFFDNGQAENYLVAYDSTDIFTFQPGRAFWVISRNDVQISEKISSTELSPDTTIAFQIHDGWNLISNPIGLEIPWSAVQKKNNVTDPIWSFNGNYREETEFSPYTGYYFYNRNGLEELVIPYAADAEIAEPEINSQQLLTLSLIQYAEPQSSVEVGFSSLKSNQSGEKIDFAPPGDFQDYNLTLVSNEHSTEYPYLSRIISEPSGKMQSYKLRVKAPDNASAVLIADGLNTLASYRVLLIDTQTSRKYDLHQTPEINFKSANEYKEFRLVLGTPEHVDGNIGQEGPREIVLYQNYPNPFNNQTVIEYRVPERMANQRVHLEIFNVLGQRVATLVNESQPAGLHQVHWNAESEGGGSLASGLYFYQLRVGDNVKTRRLTLLK